MPRGTPSHFPISNRKTGRVSMSFKVDAHLHDEFTALAHVYGWGSKTEIIEALLYQFIDSIKQQQGPDVFKKWAEERDRHLDTYYAHRNLLDHIRQAMQVKESRGVYREEVCDYDGPDIYES